MRGSGLPRRLRATRSTAAEPWVVAPADSVVHRRRAEPRPNRDSHVDVGEHRGGTFDSLLWDLDADGQYDDAGGATVSHTFLKGGTVQVGLLASKLLGDWASTRQTIRIGRPPVARRAKRVFRARKGGASR